MDVSVQAQLQPLSTLSTFSYIPPRRQQTKEMSYFIQESKDLLLATQLQRRSQITRTFEKAYEHHPKQVPEVSAYDKVYHQAEGYNMKLHRDDRKHYKGSGLDINKEEKSRAVPVLSSSEYGRRPVPVLCETGRQYTHVDCIKAEFFMKNGMVWNVAEGYGSVAPN